MIRPTTDLRVLGQPVLVEQRSEHTVLQEDEVLSPRRRGARYDILQVVVAGADLAARSIQQQHEEGEPGEKGFRLIARHAAVQVLRTRNNVDLRSMILKI